MTLLKEPLSLLQEAVNFAHACEISKPYGQIELILNWARQNLDHEWRWQLIECSTDKTDGRYIFYFESEKDCMTFVLRWC